MVVEIVQNFQSNFPPKKRGQAPSKTPEKQRRGGEGNEGKFSSNKRRGCKLCELEGCASLAGGQGSLPKKKKIEKKSQMNGGGRNSSRVSCLTRQFGSLSRKGLSRKGGRVSNVPSTGWRRRRRKRLASPIDRLGYPRISVITAWKVADYRGRPEVE